MVSSINLGNISQENGKTILTGSQSGLDTKALIDALTTVRAQPATDLTTLNDTLDKQKSAYADLLNILTTFQSSVDVLRNPPGVQNAAQNIFEYRTATLTSNTAVSANNYLSVTAEPGAAVQNFTVNEIHQLARETKQHTADFTSIADPTVTSVVEANGVYTAGLFSAGTFTLAGIDGAADQDITLEAGDSLYDVVNKFNAVKSSTGVTATLVKVSDQTYEINFTGTKTGADYDFDLSDTPGGMGSKVTADADGVLSMVTAAVGFTNTQSAQNSQVTIDGVTVQRSTNSIDDLIDGMTFTLQQATPGGTTVGIAIQPDTSIVKNAIQAFGDAYNNFKLFAAKQQERNSDGTPKDTALLANDPTLRSIISIVNAEVNNIVGGITTGEPDKLADIGISFDDFAGDANNPPTKNVMTIDTDALTSALAANYDGVRGVFEYQMMSDNQNLSTFARTNALGVSTFTLNIDRNNDTYQALYTDPTTHLATTVDLTPTVLSSGVTLAGPAGSALEGLQLIFISDVSTAATIHVTISQGIADRLYNSLHGMTDEQDGSLTNATQAITDQENHNNTEIARINDQVATYRDQLTQKYANLEAALTKANQLLALLTAQSNAQLAASQ